MKPLSAREKQEFAKYLWRVRAPSECGALTARVAADWHVDSDDAERVLRQVLCASLANPIAADAARTILGRKPLVAARHLLGLVPYPNGLVLDESVPGTGKTVQDLFAIFKEEGVDRRGWDPAQKRTQNRMIAAVAGNFTEDREAQGKATNEEFLEMARVIWHHVATYQAAMDQSEWEAVAAPTVYPATSPDADEILPQHTGSATTADAAQRQLNEIAQATRSRLLSLPNGYPKHLATQRLADELRMTEVTDLEELTRGDGLYSHRPPSGRPEPALGLLPAARAVVLGDPGSGKSTLLSALVSRWIDSETGVAVFVRLDDLGRRASERSERLATLTDTDALDLMVEAWESWANCSLDSAARAFVMNELRGNPDTLIALDGLDEVSLLDARQSAVRELLALLEDHVIARVVVASRVTAYRRPFVEAKEYFVEELQADQVRSFVLDWFADRPESDPARQAALNALTDERIRYIAGVPVIAGIICYVADDGAVESSLYGLYRQYVNRYLRRTWRPVSEHRSAIEVDDARRDAQSVAWMMAGLERVGQREAAWLDVASLAQLSAASGRPASALLDLYYRDGLLVTFGTQIDSDPMSQQVRWLHRTVHEHLAGRQLAERALQNLDEGVELLLKAALRPAWEVPWHHVAGAMNDFGILPEAVDALWQRATQADTAGERIARSAAKLLIWANSNHRRDDVVVLLRRHHEWDILRDFDSGPLLEELRATPAKGAAAVKVGELTNAVSWIDDVDGVDWGTVELMRELGQNPNLYMEQEVVRMAWKIDRARTVSETLDQLDSGASFAAFYPFPQGHFPPLTKPELERLVAISVRRIDEGDLFPLWNFWSWMSGNYSEAWKAIEEAASHRFGHRYIGEWSRSVRSDEPWINWDAVGAEGMLCYSAACQPGGRVALGWELAERGLDLPEQLDDWCKAGYRFGEIEWSSFDIETAAFDIGAIDDGAELVAGALNADWSKSPAALDRVRLALMQCMTEPTPQVLQALFKWNLTERPYDDGSANGVHLDSNWFTNFLNHLPWRPITMVGLAEIESLPGSPTSYAADAVRWTLGGLDSGLRNTSTACEALPLFEKLVHELVDPGQDPRLIEGQLGLISHNMFDDWGPYEPYSNETVVQVLGIIETRVRDAIDSRSGLYVSLLDAVDDARYQRDILS